MPHFVHCARTAHSSSNIDTGRSLKRQKTRKGTRSCWACKRRKMKCTYASPANDVCIGCTRRCLDCISQEFPDQDPGPSSKSRMVGYRIGRLESMIQQLAEQVTGRVASSGLSSTVAKISIPVPPSMTQSKHQTLSQELLAAYPSATDLHIIGSTCDNLSLNLLQKFAAQSNLLQTGVTLELMNLWGEQQQQLYTAETHPVLIARQMLLLAGVLQHMPATESARSHSSRYQQLGELSQPPRTLARRLAEAATTLVTAHDKFTTNTLEGLDCIWLEAVYHEHNGNLRHSWLACRRAISAVHVMGFHGRQYPRMASPRSILPQPNGVEADLQQIWFRLVHSELALCLALEMPPSASCPDEAFTSVAYSVTKEDNNACTSKLERKHAAIASHFLKQREHEPDFTDLDAAHQICMELEEAASTMSSEWWSTPNLADHAGGETDDDNHLFGAVMKLRAQIFHFHLLLLAELPCMLQATCGEPTINTTTANEHRHHHHNCFLGSSRNICIKASRDLLHRFLRLRSCKRTASYFRLLESYAWHAAATLLLALLLDGFHTTTTTSLGRPDHQQQLSDRALASKAMEKVQLAGDEDEDVLFRLLALEASGTVIAVTYRKPSGASLGNSDALVLSIPFVGLVSITPQAQNGSALSEDCSILSGTTGCFDVAPDDETGPQDSDDDSEEEEEDDLMKAMNLRRSAKWAIAHYMLRPA
ncbi:c6 zinc finger domain containing protein [Grosmannia clavigera kw1407]|uniref:C6 zinc finger domain containing protein n=1 Tax=Grosmannia clavigera (strain kw1407 / UAMH 11150) TaxID=655863 RepID=F0XLI4_GROCL|nr:c6 zinc finger domain containing protein [Grosmannia clavigera kw1407]EFX01128.1 c6 zinc finger domain containing protein [Grosmannia clavigera kw1407]